MTSTKLDNLLSQAQRKISFESPNLDVKDLFLTGLDKKIIKAQYVNPNSLDSRTRRICFGS